MSASAARGGSSPDNYGAAPPTSGKDVWVQDQLTRSWFHYTGNEGAYDDWGAEQDKAWRQRNATATFGGSLQHAGGFVGGDITFILPGVIVGIDLTTEGKVYVHGGFGTPGLHAGLASNLEAYETGWSGSGARRLMFGGNPQSGAVGYSSPGWAVTWGFELSGERANELFGAPPAY
jgi:hypothetical protein